MDWPLEGVSDDNALQGDASVLGKQPLSSLSVAEEGDACSVPMLSCLRCLELVLTQAFEMGGQTKETALLSSAACWHGPAITTSFAIAVSMSRSCQVYPHRALNLRQAQCVC